MCDLSRNETPFLRGRAGEGAVGERQKKREKESQKKKRVRGVGKGNGGKEGTQSPGTLQPKKKRI